MSPPRTIRPNSTTHFLLAGASLTEPRVLADLRSHLDLRGNVSAYAGDLQRWGLLAHAGWEPSTPGGQHLRRLYLLTEAGAAALAEAGPVALSTGRPGPSAERSSGDSQGTPADRASHDAASEVLEQCRADGHPVASPFEAVLRGHITELDWCAVLDRHRERHGLTD